MHSLFATSVLLTAPVLAQEPTQQDPLAGGTGTERPLAETPELSPKLPQCLLHSLSRSLLIDELGDGTIWAAGPSWKASFEPEGFTYVPFLGSDAPRNHPIRFALESVTVGGEPLALDDAAVVTRSAERSITLDRASVREVYHLSEDSVEQTFVLDSLPGSGDVVLRLSVVSDLDAHAEGDGFAFLGERGGVRYGAATGVSATGVRTALAQEFVDGVLEIRVPATQLDAECFPFVVDPILSTFGVTADSRDQVDVDVSYDATSGVYLIVYEEVQSLADRDVRSVFYNTSLELLVSPASIDITSDNWTEPRVASSFEDSLFLCVATRGATVGSRDIWGRTRDAGNGVLGSQFAITSLPGDNAHPDVGGFGGSFQTVNPFLVVWENYLSVADDHDVYGQVVGVTGAVQGPLLAIADSPTEDDMRPQISHSSGRPNASSGDQEYLVAWERRIAPDDRDIWTRVVDYNGSLMGHDAWLSYSFGDSRNVTVSSQERDIQGLPAGSVYVLAFERLRNGVFEIFAVVTQEGNADNARSVTEMQDIALGDQHADPHVANDGTGDYLIAYSSEAPGGFDAHITTVNIVRDSGEVRTGVAERRESFPHPTGGAGALAIASTYDGGETPFSSRAMVVFTAPGAGSDQEVSGAFVAEGSANVEGSQFCEASVNASGESAWIRASGTGNVAGGSVDIQVEDLPLNAFGYVITSLDTGFTVNPGGSAGNLCLSGAIGRFNAQVMNSGAMGRVFATLDLNSVPQPSGFVAVMPGERWKFQYWTRDVQSGQATSNFSNAVAVDFQ